MTDYSTRPEFTAALSRISWGGVAAGVFVALAAELLLNLLGVGLGAAAIDPHAAGQPAASTVSIVSGLWYAAAGVICCFVGGYVSSRLSGRPGPSTGGFHGLTVWAATTLLMLYLLTTSVGAVVGGAFSGLGSVIGGAGGVVSTAAQTVAPALSKAPNPFAGIEQEVRAASGDADPEALRAAAVSAVQAALTGDPAHADDARNRAAEAIARAQNISIEQARTQVGEYEAKYRQTLEDAKRRARDAAATTATAVSRGSILGVIALALGAIAAWFGGVVGTVPERRLAE